MTHASLFSGIGGFDLAAEWAGWTNAFNCEIDPFCQKVLKYHFPYATQYSDIKSTDFTIWRGRIDVLTGGFPCQPFSLAGKRKGTDDDRHLWPQMLRAIREISPRWVVGENVIGIVNWSGGLVFDEVCADLEAEGYEVQPVIIPACGVGAPHQRYRVWFVAHASGNGGSQNSERQQGANCKNKVEPQCLHNKRTTTNPDNERLEQQPRNAVADRPRQFGRHNAPCGFDAFPTQPPICSRDDGVSARLDGITFPAWRMHSIKAYGNAIVPQVVYQIFEAINEFEKQNEL